MLFLSDLHLGSPLCRAEDLCNFLSKYPRRDKVMLVGDVFDDVTFDDWPGLHIVAIELLLDFDDITYLPGNHDRAMRKLIGFDTGRIRICDEAFYLASNGKRYLVTHGDRLDPTLWLTPPVWVRKLFATMTPTGIHGRLSGGLQKRLAIKDAAILDCDGVICGHSHVPEQDVVSGLEYHNCGDWIEHSTAVIDDGEIRLVSWRQDDVSKKAA